MIAGFPLFVLFLRFIRINAATAASEETDLSGSSPGRLRGVRRHGLGHVVGSNVTAFSQSSGFETEEQKEKFVLLFSEELYRLRAQIEDEKFECAARKASAESETVELQSAMGRAASAIAAIEATSANYAGQLASIEPEIIDARERMKAVHHDCEQRELGLRAKRDEAEKELKRVAKFAAEMLKTCHDSGASCANVSDSADHMTSVAQSTVTLVERELAESAKHCQSEVEPLNAEIRQRVLQLSDAQGMVAQQQASRSELQVQVKRISAELDRLAEHFKAEQQRCADAMAQLEQQAALAVETRQLVFKELFSAETQDSFQDCQVGDWSTGSCSKSCAEKPGKAGKQVSTREAAVKPTDATLAGRLSMRCPPLKRTTPCNDVPCPVDCVMGEWSAWALCSRKCGGGEQYRTRSPERPSAAGGMVCGGAIESRACNMQSCSQDCVLGDWSEWGMCSSRCRWETTPAGHQHRSRPVLTDAFGDGACPSEAERSETRECNDRPCPTEKGKMLCETDQDVIIVLDGSGSVAVSDPNVPEKANFMRQRNFAKRFMENSVFSETAGFSAGSGKFMRYGVVVSGSAAHTSQLAIPLSGNQEAVVQKLDSLEWPQGTSPLSEGLATAAQAMRDSEAKHTTVFVFSDGKIASPHLALEAAQRLRGAGARVLVALAMPEGDGALADSMQVLCGVASAPCEDNLVRVQTFGKMPVQFYRFLAMLCPVRFNAPPPVAVT